jgi:hypothetical protein
VKLTFLSGIVCVLFGALAGYAQQPPPSGEHPLVQDQPASQDQAASPQDPPAQTPPPAQQPPPPAQQPPPPVTAPGTPSIPKPVVQLPPPVPTQTPTPPQERDTGGDTFSIMALYWLNNDQPVMRGGAGDTTLLQGNLHFTGNKKYAYAGVVTIPTSRENSLEFTYWRKQGYGTSVIGDTTYNFFGNNFAPGDSVLTRYTLEGLKLSWNYLTWPYPSNGAKLRIKTLWEVQYVGIGTTFDAPADPDAIPTNGNKSVILPTLGLGVEYHPAKHLRLEAKASGFGIVHHSDIWDVQASVVLRYGRLEFFLSEKGYHYKTSPQGDQYFTQTILGPVGGVRFMFK